jgi:hypothetical protein
MSDSACDLLADLLVDEPIAVEELLARHVSDGQGHCRSCPVGGQRGYQIWPCTIYAAVVLALKRRGIHGPESDVSRHLSEWPRS